MGTRLYPPTSAILFGGRGLLISKVSYSNGKMDDPPNFATEEDVEEKETKTNEVTSPSVSLQFQDDESEVLVDPIRKSLTIKEMAQVWRTKNTVLEYEKAFEGKLSAVNICRDDLMACQGRLETMRGRKDALLAELEQAVESNNNASRGLLEAMVGKVTNEIDSELEVEMVLRESLKEAELSLLTAELNFSKHLPLQQIVAEKGDCITAMKAQQAVGRLKREEALLSNYVCKKNALEKKQTKAQSEDEVQQIQAAVEAKRAGEVTQGLMEATMEREQSRKGQQEREKREVAEGRLKAMLELKQSIVASKETMKKKGGDDARGDVITEGEVAGEDLLERKTRERLEEFTKKLEHFDVEHRNKELQIVQKLLSEEHRMRQQQERLSKPHWRPREVVATAGDGQGKKAHKKKKLAGGAKVTPTSAMNSALAPEEEQGTLPTEATVAVDQKEREGAKRDEKGPGVMTAETLIRPEFDGLWSTVPPASGPLLTGEAGNDFMDRVGREGMREDGQGCKQTMSKMEKDILQRNLQRQKETITQTQVVAGREFKGPAYRSTPDVVEFKDFVVGKEYKCVIQLTNISYTINTCKLLGVSDNLKNFLSVQFTPPGLMSAGIACTMVAIFEPMIEEDVDGAIEMMAQTGPFSVPVRCRRKRCAVSMSESIIDFGRVCRGESQVRKLSLRNTGALGTELAIRKRYTSALQHSDAALKDKPSIASEPLPPPLPLLAEDRKSGRDATLASSVAGDTSQSKPSPDTAEERPATTTEASEGGTQEGQEVCDKECQPAVLVQPSGEDGVTVVTSEVVLSASDSTAHFEEGKAATPTTLEQCRSLSCSNDISMEPVTASLQAYSELVIAVHFSPTSLGDHAASFVIEFCCDEVDKVDVQVTGVCVDIPVTVEREVTDFGICEVDKTYQDSLMFCNSSSSALQMSFDIPPQCTSYLEVLPKQAVIQPHSNFTAQLRFSPKPGIPVKQGADGRGHDDATGQLFSTQILARVANQVLPVVFAVSATLTPSALEFSVREMDFGCVGIHESVLSSIGITNTSLLVQEIGFVNVPDIVEVQPADGYLTLLPLETLQLDVIVAPSKAGPFSFKLTCVSGNGRKYCIPCKGRAVQPPLSLTHNVVQFGATPVNSTTTARTNLVYNGSKPGKRGAAVMFEFCLPPSCPVTVSPRTGVLAEGQNQVIQVQFSPKLEEEEVAAEAARMVEKAEAERCKLQEELARQQAEAQRELAASQKKGQKQSSHPRSGTSKPTIAPATAGSTDTQGLAPINPSLFRSAAEQSLITQFTTHEVHVKIPCFVCASKPKGTSQHAPSYKMENTVYLEVQGRAVRPSIVVASSHGQTKLDFGEVTIGERVVKEVYLKNISDKPVDIASPLLDPTGPFCILNAFRHLEPGALHRVAISFGPTDPQPCYEPLCLNYHGNSAYLKLLLVGRGVPLNLVLEGVEDSQLDFGHTLAGDSSSRQVKLKNQSTNPVSFSATVTSCPEENTGVFNFDGSCAFECTPACGRIAPGAMENVTFTFSPDHQSVHYRNKAHFCINSKEKVYQFVLKGRAWEAGMYATTVPDSAPSLPVESLCPQEETHGPKVLVLTFVQCLKDESVSVLTRLIEIGSIKSSSLKKTILADIHLYRNMLPVQNGGEYSFDALQGSGAKHFACDSMKGSVEGGGCKQVKISFTPPKGERSATPESSTVLSLKGESTVQYRVLLRGVVME